MQAITKNKRYYGVHMIDVHTEYTDVPELITLLPGMQPLTLWSNKIGRYHDHEIFKHIFLTGNFCVF